MARNYENVINASHDFITLISKDYVYDFANDAYCAEIGRSRDEIVGTQVWEIWGQEKFDQKIKPNLDKVFQGQEIQDIDRFVFGDSYKYIHASFLPYYEDGEITHAMIYSHDISLIKNLESRLIDYEYKDPLTGLFNRKSFDVVFDMEIDKARRSPTEPLRGLYSISLSNYNEIAMENGLDVADLLLESTGIRIKDTLRAADMVFRLEGGDFAAIANNPKHKTDLATIAERLWSRITMAYTNKSGSILMECHIGISLFPDDGATSKELLRASLSALNEAKQSNEKYILFNKSLHQKSIDKLRLKADIRKALVDQQFHLMMQPIVSSTGQIVGAEALIRWNHPEMNSIPPMKFIPLAEETGDIIMIGRWMLYQVCRYIQKWEQILGDRYISINFSTIEFNQPNLAEYVAEIIADVGIEQRRRLKVEITETQFMENMEQTIETIEKLKEMGIDVFIDDFGAGYSSLSYLKRLPAHTIKVDRVFVDEIADNSIDMEFLDGLIRMIQSRKKSVVVEGVEDRRQFDLLQAYPDLKIQGYYFSKPIAPEQFEAYIQSGKPLPQ